MIDQIVSWSIKYRSKMFGSDRHPDTISKTLAQWTCSYLNSWGNSKLRMSWRLAPPLSKILQILHRDLEARQI